jgi:hypothetical protein
VSRSAALLPILLAACQDYGLVTCVEVDADATACPSGVDAQADHDLFPEHPSCSDDSLLGVDRVTEAPVDADTDAAPECCYRGVYRTHHAGPPALCR